MLPEPIDNPAELWLDHNMTTETLTIARKADEFIQNHWADGLVLSVADMLDVEPELPIHEWEVRITTDWELAFAASWAGPAEYECQGYWEVYTDQGKCIDTGDFGPDGPENLSLAWLIEQGKG